MRTVLLLTALLVFAFVPPCFAQPQPVIVVLGGDQAPVKATLRLWREESFSPAVLQPTHLAGFGADFATAHRFLLEGTACLWQRADWTRLEPPAVARCGESGGE